MRLNRLFLENDERYRELERMAASGDPEAVERYTLEKERSGDYSLEIRKLAGPSLENTHSGPYQVSKDYVLLGPDDVVLVSDIPPSEAEEADEWVASIEHGRCPIYYHISTDDCLYCRRNLEVVHQTDDSMVPSWGAIKSWQEEVEAPLIDMIDAALAIPDEALTRWEKGFVKTMDRHKSQPMRLSARQRSFLAKLLDDNYKNNRWQDESDSHRHF